MTKLVLAPANVPEDWRRSGIWRKWEAPLNAVRGESHYQKALRTIVGPLGRDGALMFVAARLIREPWNPHGAEAIRVETCGAAVGYIAKEMAALISPLLDRSGCNEFSVAGIIRGGNDEETLLGLHLWLSRRLTPGPEITIYGDGGDFRVPWPPG